MRHSVRVNMWAAAGLRHAVLSYANDHDEHALAIRIETAVPGLSTIPFGRLIAEQSAHLVRDRWQDISNRRDVYKAFFEGRPQRTDRPFDINGVTQELLAWIENLIEKRPPDGAPGSLTAKEAARTYGVSRATAYRILHAEDPELVLEIWARAIRRETVRQLVAQGRTLAAARRLLDRYPELFGNAAVAPPPRQRRTRG